MRYLTLLGVLFTLACWQPMHRNVVVVMLDDIGVESLALYGTAPGQTIDQQAQTPHLDALARRGVTFDRAYTYPVCAPTRAAFQTGLDSDDSGFGSNGLPTLDVRHHTIAKAFQAAGYATAHVGKWSGGVESSDGECVPHLMGFDVTEGQMSIGASHFDWHNGRDCERDPEPSTTYQDTASIDTAIEFAQAKQDEGVPYFLYLALASAHRPWDYPPHELTPYEDRYATGTRPPARRMHEDTPAENREDVAYFNAIVSAVDHELGRLLAAVSEDTIVVVTSDNGTPEPVVDQRYFDYRKVKGSPYPGGVRVPLILAGPAIEDEHRGSRSDALVQVTDLFATLVHIEHIYTPLPASSQRIGARSLARGVIFEPYGFDSSDRVVRVAYATDGRYTLLLPDTRRRQLEMYDLEADPYTTEDIIDDLSPEEQVVHDALHAQLVTRVGEAACSNGLDDDGDGAIDDGDDGCSGDLDRSELPILEAPEAPMAFHHSAFPSGS